jgi:hypothetical protein
MQTLCQKVIAAQDALIDRFVRLLGLPGDLEESSAAEETSDC